MWAFSYDYFIATDISHTVHIHQLRRQSVVIKQQFNKSVSETDEEIGIGMSNKQIVAVCSIQVTH